jgi:hypothetical protein
MYEYVKSFISKDLLDSRDEKLMKELRDFADEELDSIRQERHDAVLKELAPAYTGKYLLLCGGTPTKIGFTIPEKDDFVIVYVKSLSHAGEGFFTCNAVILRIKYTDSKHPPEYAAYEFEKKFSKVSVSTYYDQCYRIDFSAEPRFLSELEVNRYIQQARVDITNNCTWFLEQKFNDDNKSGDNT